jgi:RNA polymerase sigma factor (sigma-70 family)
VRSDAAVDDLLRQLAPRVVGSLVRRFGQFAECEDAVQEAMLAAATAWPDRGIPANPRGWLVTVASRRMVDHVRSDHSRRQREFDDVIRSPDGGMVSAVDDDDARPSAEDDTLTLLFLCCHPALSPSSQLALTLRAVGGLTTAEIASAFLVPEATMGQRISRAKQQIRGSGAAFEMPPAEERDQRLTVVLHVLYLIFNEGYTASSGPSLQRSDLTAEAIRLARILHRLLPDDGEVAGLLALMVLTDARRLARAGDDGSLIPLAEQDRSLWNQDAIAEGVALITHTLAHARLGPYQLQAAIAAVHDEAPTSAETDWPQVLALYELLEKIAPNPMATLNHAVAMAMVHGPRAGLDMVATLDTDERVRTHHRVEAVRAHLLEMAGDNAPAYEGYRRAARRTTSVPERRYLEARAARLRYNQPLRRNNA